MKQVFGIVIAAGVLVTGLAACKSKAPEVAPTSSAPAPVTPGAPGQAPMSLPAPPAGAPASGPALITGTVVETMNAGSYTYVQVDDGTRKIWAAAPQFEIKKGDKLTVPEGMPMENYESKTLNRTFDLVYFVASMGQGGGASAPAAMPPMPPMPAASGEGAMMPEGAHPKLDPAQAAKDANVSFAGIKKADKTVGEIFAGQKSLGGKDVSVRGKVVKFSPQIMGKNWVHVQDGSGAAGSNDLTITTQDSAKVGDTVLVSGKITLNKDFGMGYRYDLIIEDGKVKTE